MSLVTHVAARYDKAMLEMGGSTTRDSRAFRTYGSGFVTSSFCRNQRNVDDGRQRPMGMRHEKGVGMCFQASVNRVALLQNASQ
jgi:hypothetical protein